MKKLGKLSINPEKVIKNEELVNLRGGYGGGYGDCDPIYKYSCTCKDHDGNNLGTITFYGNKSIGGSCFDVATACWNAYPSSEQAACSLA